MASCVWNARHVPDGRYTATIEFDTGPFEKGKVQRVILGLEREEEF